MLDFKVDVALLRSALQEMGFAGLAVSGANAERLASLPPIHKDPFDRMLRPREPLTTAAAGCQTPRRNVRVPPTAGG